MKAVTVAVMALFLPVLGLAQGDVIAYRCVDDAGRVSYQQTPCDDEGEALDITNVAPEGAAARNDVGLVQSSCRGDHGFLTAAGYLVNRTGEPKEVTVRVTFTRRGAVMQTSERRQRLRPYGRHPIQILGNRHFADRCEWQFEW